MGELLCFFCWEKCLAEGGKYIILKNNESIKFVLEEFWLINSRKVFSYFGIFLLASIFANGVCYFYYSPVLETANYEKFTGAKNVPSDHNLRGIEGYGNIIIEC